MTAVSLIERLYLHCRATGLFPEPGAAVVAVSGGPDSVALLDLMCGLSDRLAVTLSVAHADHGILEGSAAVAAQVENLASRYGIPCDVGRLALGTHAGETRARTARYRFLRQVQHQRAARYLLTAHHADDQAETVLLRLLRGSAPAGLAGIPSVGPGGLERPLLPFTRQELGAHAAALGVPLATDPSNADPRHMRAWVRTALLPLLHARLGDDAGAALRDVARHARRELSAWEALLDELPGLDVRIEPGVCDVARVVVTGYHKALAERVLRAAARRSGMRLGPAAAARAVRFAARGASGRRIDLGGGLLLEIAFDRLAIRASGAQPAALRIRGDEGAAAFGRWQVRWSTEPAPSTALARTGWTTWIAAGPLLARAPRPGDRLVPLGGTGHRRVARLLMEARVARAERAGYPVVAAGGAPSEAGGAVPGESGTDVIWLPGVCRAAARVPEPGTSALRIDVGQR